MPATSLVLAFGWGAVAQPPLTPRSLVEELEVWVDLHKQLLTTATTLSTGPAQHGAYNTP
jgi:hypothetical protein